ncbi:kinase-like domain-containing protein [Rhizophagus irregularis DAOM 181602=DAOM 197198]|uniref:Kinase-like domain-containing protein n=1 Tax=Rhizophagus irregularis (strain DAOM 181602 / DAOM 197198 / MUCL 43194) TaxID=747089 RepID=A0A2P4QJA0_RHIID|nr:kinase-like domain-containing protein [Rhizophagus irregularis DAOM 181602=DAOM 197198]POG77704.1 kinase-like domain-containing protein [Rhizophagus irregularis DAOM 181602=DAOM 197198]|eukprot:XP_025184570.1 kinase-like domain-containing protein [Rhizophagus irregularis DAOM 181602=DAOM 197198]
MEEYMLNDDVFEQIKHFNHKYLTEEQSLLIDKLILNEELKIRYKERGLCKKCKQPKNYRHLYRCKLQQNFKNWTSGNHKVDKFIQKTQLKVKYNSDILEWIEYDRFENVEYLAKGGFGTIYKAIWKDGWITNWDFENNNWIRSKYYCREYENFPVVLKCLHNSQDITSDLLSEIETHHMIYSKHVDNITHCYGITKDPESRNFMMVMGYVINGSLRQHLNNNFNSTKWDEKLIILQSVAKGLACIHEYGLVHRDFHCGNILKDSYYTFITDLGLLLPYVAPDVLRGKEYTQESDIYGFGIVAYEVCTGLPPYHDIAHDKFLAISICQGLRPKSNYKIPQFILNIIKQCWDADPLKRPKANELYDLLKELNKKLDDDETENKKQVEETEEINEKLISSTSLYTGCTLSYVTNPQAVYMSRLLDFKNLPEPKNAIDNKDDDDRKGGDNSLEEYSESIEAIDFTKLNLNKSN